MSHDFSAGASDGASASAAGCCHALRANRPIWPSPPVGPIRPGSEAVFVEARLLQHALPLRALEQGLLRTQVAIGEPPPTARQAEDGFRPELRRRGVHEDEAAARREQVAQMAERRADVAHGVEHIGADDEVERSRGEILLGARFFEIENLARRLRETPPSFCSAPGKKPAETSVNV